MLPEEPVDTSVPPASMLVISILLTLFCFPFTGFVAIYYSVMSRKAWEEARRSVSRSSSRLYTDEERESAIKDLGPHPEITRFKGLGEISPNEFVHFIGKDIRLEPVRLSKGDSIETVLSYYMGKNTPERQDFIIDNLYIEKDEIR